MAAERGQSSQKLVYLRDHAHRPRGPRATRRSATPPPADLAGEATWLARSLYAVTAALVLHWIYALGGADALAPEGPWHVTASQAVPELFVAGSAFLSARSLLRGDPRGELPTGIAAGALIVLALESLGHTMMGGDFEDLSLSVRTDVLVQTVALAIGIWSASFALRAYRRPTG